jgi:hypothetical protein
MKPQFKKHSIQLLRGEKTFSRVFVHDVTGDGTKKFPFRYWVDVPATVKGENYSFEVLRREPVLASRLKPLPPKEARMVAREQREMRKAKLKASCTIHGAFEYPMYDVEGFHQFHTHPECPTCVKKRVTSFEVSA